jgi:hypothetical protein
VNTSSNNEYSSITECYDQFKQVKRSAYKSLGISSFDSNDPLIPSIPAIIFEYVLPTCKAVLVNVEIVGDDVTTPISTGTLWTIRQCMAIHAGNVPIISQTTVDIENKIGSLGSANLVWGTANTPNRLVLASFNIPLSNWTINVSETYVQDVQL